MREVVLWEAAVREVILWEVGSTMAAHFREPVVGCHWPRCHPAVHVSLVESGV